MADDDREQPEVDVDRPQRRVQRDARDDARQGEREDHDEAQALPAEEAVALHRQGDQ